MVDGRWTCEPPPGRICRRSRGLCRQLPKARQCGPMTCIMNRPTSYHDVMKVCGHDAELEFTSHKFTSSSCFRTCVKRLPVVASAGSSSSEPTVNITRPPKPLALLSWSGPGVPAENCLKWFSLGAAWRVGRRIGFVWICWFKPHGPCAAASLLSIMFMKRWHEYSNQWLSAFACAHEARRHPLFQNFQG